MKKNVLKIALMSVVVLVSCSKNDDVQSIEKENSSEGLMLVSSAGARVSSTEYPTGDFNYSGSDFEGWNVVIGDANYVLPNEASIVIDDIETENQDSLSVLYANVDNRYIMTHNITYMKAVSSELLNMKHTAEYSFKIPYNISTQNTDYNGQTVEGGLFVWDGANTQLDYGLAFQWLLNPWIPEFGDIRYWDGANWQYLTSLAVDTAYHTIVFELDFETDEAFLTIDGTKYTQNVFSSTPKVGWGTTVDGRFQAEAISIFPSAQAPSTPTQKVCFKDWEWDGKEF